jgi:4-hydroxy-L-threonine phosphate dehydrogenase PdxA
MNTKPILIVSGEPYSVLFEILFKSLEKYKPKNPLIVVGSKRLMQDQITELKLSKKISINFIKQNYKISDLKKKFN